mmetsp:Transcript_13518/g.53144  ORF Transcript_13518/g.53144 Transcript_13518/m.53144 type:complete len:236 (-) Transcript_13518:4864-5571(-)
MTLLAMSGYVSMACIPSFLYYSSAVKKRSLLVVIALASCTSAMVFWFIVLGVAQGIEFESAQTAALLLTLCAIVGDNVVSCKCIENFLAAQARARGNSKVRCRALLSALAGETFIDAYDMVPAFLFAAWNCGQAFFRTFHCYISFVNLSRGQGTYYAKDCERFSLFLDAAMISLLLFTTYSCGKNSTHQHTDKQQNMYSLAPRALSLLTIGNLYRDSCLAVLCCLCTLLALIFQA